MRILQIVADGTPGGGTTVVLGFCEELKRLPDVEVALITDEHSYAAEAAAAIGIFAFEVPFFVSRFDPRPARQMLGILNSWKPDLIHVHGARAAHPFTFGALSQTRTPLVYTVHGFHFRKKGPILRSLIISAEKRIAARADSTIFVSEADKELASRLGISRSTRGPAQVILNGISPEQLDQVPQRDKAYDLVYAARMQKEKNPLFMIRIMEALKGAGIRLLMVGGGKYERAARELARKLHVEGDIDFTGQLNRVDTLEAIRSSKILVLPSLWEGMPIVVMEALYYGLPVVASKIEGTTELVNDGITGVLVEGFDPQAYSVAIRQLLEDSERRARMSAAGSEMARTRLLRSISFRAHADLYGKLLGTSLSDAD